MDDASTLINMISNVGMPSIVCVYLLYNNRKFADEIRTLTREVRKLVVEIRGLGGQRDDEDMY